MNLQSLPTRRLVADARPGSFAPNTRAILDRLGCHILTPEEFALAQREEGGGGGPPDLYLVDEDGLASLPRADAASVPVVLLTRAGGGRDDTRVAAAVRTPVGMHDLYRVLQQILEEKPRSTPRIVTDLAAECRHAGDRWSGTVRSLSENGCLLRSDETLPLGAELRVSFALPRVGKLHVRAETAYEIKPCLGLVFSSTSAQIREAIRDFIVRSLLEVDPATPRPTG